MAVKCRIIRGREVCPKPNLFMESYLGKGIYPLFSAAADDVFDLMPTEPLPQLKSIMAKFIDSQVASGNWPEPTVPGSGLMDCFQFYAMDTAANAVINWIGDFSNGLLVNSPTHTPFTDILGNGTNQYINTQYNPTDDGVNIGQDNLMAGVFVVDNLDTNTNKRLFGFDSTVDFFTRQQTSPDIVRFSANDISLRSTGSTTYLDNTLYSLERHLSTTKRIRVNEVSEIFSVASTGLVNGDFQVLATNAANNINAKVACFYASASTVGGFDYDGFLTALNTLITDTAALG